jgi:putative nucleotidyltransferase with HDIG domain
MNAQKINVILDDFENTNPKLYRHSERVAMIAYAFAQEINLTHEEREIAYFCGMLHDIGKFYLDEIADEVEDAEAMNEIVGGSMVYFDKDFSKLIPVISNRKNISERDSERYGYNVNIIKLIITLANEYDNYREKGLTHEKTCECIRNNNQKNNNMVTVLFKTIIKNKINYEY